MESFPAGANLHTISWNQTGSEGLVSGWSQVTQIGWPTNFPGISYDGDPYQWQPDRGARS